CRADDDPAEFHGGRGQEEGPHAGHRMRPHGTGGRRASATWDLNIPAVAGSARVCHSSPSATMKDGRGAAAQTGIMAPLAPAWDRTSLILFCVVELALLVTLRTTSGLAHLHAVQDASDQSAATVAARCSETVAAIDDFWPFVGLLRVGSTLPMP